MGRNVAWNDRAQGGGWRLPVHPERLKSRGTPARAPSIVAISAGSEVLTIADVSEMLSWERCRLRPRMAEI
jgi:hypothetical protein